MSFRASTDVWTGLYGYNTCPHFTALSFVFMHIFVNQTVSSWACGWPRNPGKELRSQGMCGSWWEWDPSRVPSYLNKRNNKYYILLWLCEQQSEDKSDKWSQPHFTFSTCNGRERFEEPCLFARHRHHLDPRLDAVHRIDDQPQARPPETTAEHYWSHTCHVHSYAS